MESQIVKILRALLIRIPILLSTQTMEMMVHFIKKEIEERHDSIVNRESVRLSLKVYLETITI